MAEVLGLVTARGGSKGLPGKNLRLLGGRPLIAWTLSAARGSRCISRVVVSTDDPEIARVSREWGGDAPFLRPAELAGDASPHIDVVLHALEWLAERQGYVPDWVVLLQPTSPFRTSDDIENAWRVARETGAPAVVSVVETHDHPYLARRIGPDGVLEEFVRTDLAYLRRQDLPKAYALNGAIYACRRDDLMGERTFEPAGARGYEMPPERSMQIDTAWDFRLCELICADRGIGGHVASERRDR